MAATLRLSFLPACLLLVSVSIAVELPVNYKKGPCVGITGLERCECTTDTLGALVWLECVDLGLSDCYGLRFLPATIKNITFVGNNLGELGPNIFGTQTHFPELIGIDMSRNGITRIDGQSFHRVSAVHDLDLSFNNWIPINEVRVFSNFESLARLFLRSAFATMSNETTETKHVANLKSIFRGSNLSGLVHLDISENNFYFLHPDFTCDLPLLESLRLDNNELLDVLLYNNCTRNVRSISVRTNALTTIPRATLMEFVQMPKLEVLDLTGNPWECNCNIEEFVEYLKTEKSHVFISEELREEMICYAPGKPSIDGRRLTEVKVDELESCRYDDMQRSLRTSYTIIGLIFAAIFILLVVVIVLNRAKVKSKFMQISAPLREMAFGPANRGYSTVNI